MAFTADTIEYKSRENPGQQGLTHSGTIYKIIGPYANDSGSTGGVIDLTGKFASPIIVWAEATDEDGTAAVQVQINTPTDGKITITTTADHSGQWKALVKNN